MIFETTNESFHQTEKKIAVTSIKQRLQSLLYAQEIDFSIRSAAQYEKISGRRVGGFIIDENLKQVVQNGRWEQLKPPG